MSKIILFDVDGVLLLPEEYFSDAYSRENGLDAAKFDGFFRSPEWAYYVTGKRDVKEHIVENFDLWNWSKDPDQLLECWFEAEDVKNYELLDIIQEVRQNSVRCYAATEQEKYRTMHLRHKTFNNTLDGLYSTAEIGHKKSNPQFFIRLLEILRQEIDDLAPEDILYFDDSLSKVKSAKSVGIDARLYKDNEQTLKDLRSYV